MLVDPKGFEPSFPCLQGKSLPVRQKGPYGTDREIRTLTVQGLSLLPLPIGVRQHDGALHGDRTHYLLIDNQVCNPLHFQSMYVSSFTPYSGVTRQDFILPASAAKNDL